MSLSVVSFDFHRVLVSGLVKSTRDAVQSVLAGLPDGPAFATPVETNFEDAVTQCRKRCAAYIDIVRSTIPVIATPNSRLIWISKLAEGCA